MTDGARVMLKLMIGLLLVIGKIMLHYLFVAVIDPTGENHSDTLASDGVGAAATMYQKKKWKTYPDIKGLFSPFIIEAQGGFGKRRKR